MNLKRIAAAIASSVAAVLIFGANTAAAYTAPIDTAVNGSIIDTVGEPFIENGTSYLPLRSISETLGARVYWSDGKVSVVHGGVSADMQIGSRTAYIGGRTTTLANAPRLVNGTTYIAARTICQILGADVEWLAGYDTVSIQKEGADVVPSERYSLDDMFWLGRIIEAESGGEIYKGKIAVGNVVLNRVDSSGYPDTIYGVIFDKKYGVQFEPAANGTIYNTPSESSLRAAKLALSGTEVSGGSMYFLNPKKAQSFWIVKNKSYVTTIGNHDFYV